MSINNKYIEKYNAAYKELKTVTPAIYFDVSSPYYYMEEWLPILSRYVPNVIDGVYFISNYGKIYSSIKSPLYPNGGIMVPSRNSHGYHQINLTSNDHRKIGCKVARLVMLHFRFVAGCQYYEVDHLNGNKDDNSIWNLEWVTPQENVHRAINNGLRPLSIYNDNGILLTDLQATELYKRSFDEDYSILSKEFGVSEEYIHKLHIGTIRPYISGNHYNKRHI